MQKAWWGIEYAGTIFRYPKGSPEEMNEYLAVMDMGIEDSAMAVYNTIKSQYGESSVLSIEGFDANAFVYTFFGGCEAAGYNDRFFFSLVANGYTYMDGEDEVMDTLALMNDLKAFFDFYCSVD